MVLAIDIAKKIGIEDLFGDKVILLGLICHKLQKIDNAVKK